jgi:hypothetical protein
MCQIRSLIKLCVIDIVNIPSPIHLSKLKPKHEFFEVRLAGHSDHHHKHVYDTVGGSMLPQNFKTKLTTHTFILKNNGLPLR